MDKDSDEDGYNLYIVIGKDDNDDDDHDNDNHDDDNYDDSYNFNDFEDTDLWVVNDSLWVPSETKAAEVAR